MYSQETTLKSFTVIERIGSGSFATVYKVQRLNDRNFYAMKKVKIGEMRQKQKENALNQVRILASMNHPNIIDYKEAFFDNSTQTLCVVMEFAEAGDLQKKINKHIQDRTHFTEKEIWKTFIQLANGLRSLHDAKILHRDLKCANVFCTKDGKYKLGDLNVSKVSKKGMAQTQTGTPYYTSPEVWKNSPYDSKCDIWSLGCVVYEMAALKPPFRASNMKELYNKIQRGIFQKIPGFYSETLQQIVNMCLKVSPTSRPSASEILELPKVRANMPTEQFYTQNTHEIGPANLLRTIQVPRNLRSLKEALPKSKYEIENINLSGVSREKQREVPRVNSERRYTRNNSAQLLGGKEVPRVISTPKNDEVKKPEPQHYLFRRPSSSGNGNGKEAKSEFRDVLKVNNSNVARISRNNSMDSIRRKAESSRVESVKNLLPNENRNMNNINNSKVVNRYDQRCEKLAEKLPERRFSRERVLSREKARNEMNSVAIRCKQLQERVQGMIMNRKKQQKEQRAVHLPYISERRPGVCIPRVDSRSRILSGNREQVSGSNSRHRSFERPPSRQKSFEKVDRIQSNRSLERVNSKKRYVYQPSPRIR